MLSKVCWKLPQIVGSCEEVGLRHRDGITAAAPGEETAAEIRAAGLWF